MRDSSNITVNLFDLESLQSDPQPNLQASLQHCEDTVGAFIVFDLTRRETFS